MIANSVNLLELITTMRRFFSIAALTVGALAFGGNAALADTVPLGGSVNSISAVTSTPTAAAGSLTLYGEGVAQNDVVVQVADMALTTNNTAGVTLQASGDSGLTNGTSTLPYNVKIVADSAAAPGAVDFSSNTDSVAVSDFSGGAAARDLYIEYDAPSLLDPGNYSATITISVTDI